MSWNIKKIFVPVLVLLTASSWVVPDRDRNQAMELQSACDRWRPGCWRWNCFRNTLTLNRKLGSPAGTMKIAAHYRRLLAGNSM